MEPFDLPTNLSMDGIMADFGMDPMNLKGNSMPSVVPGIGLSSDENLSWEMIGLGLEEPLPPQEAIDELYEYCPPKKHSTDYSIALHCTSNKFTRLHLCFISSGISWR